MITLYELIDDIEYFIDITLRSDCSYYCKGSCKAYCFLDTLVLSLDYLYRGEYYG